MTCNSMLQYWNITGPTRLQHALYPLTIHTINLSSGDDSFKAITQNIHTYSKYLILAPYTYLYNIIYYITRKRSSGVFRSLRMILQFENFLEKKNQIGNKTQI